MGQSKKAQTAPEAVEQEGAAPAAAPAPSTDAAPAAAPAPSTDAAPAAAPAPSTDAAPAAAPTAFAYKATARITLGPEAGDLRLDAGQLDRLRERKCVNPGSADGWYSLTQLVDFKAGETIVLGVEAPKVLWPSLEKA